MTPLKNRREAGKILAEQLSKLDWKNTVVLGLPRGGVPVAWEIAKRLSLPWNILSVKKIGAPNFPEFALGAVASGEAPLWNEDSLEDFHLTKADLEQLVRDTRKKMKEQEARWEAKKRPSLKGKTVILADDGLATGLTMMAAVEILKRKGAKKIYVALPVGARVSVNALRERVDGVFVLMTPEPFFSVGQWYEDFSQVSDELVRDLLAGKVPEGKDDNTVLIPVQDFDLEGDLAVPAHPKGVVIFAHGSGSSRKSPRNRKVAKELNELGFATLLFDLLTPGESRNRNLVFDIDLLSERLFEATKWMRHHEILNSLPIGYFGASTGAGAALKAAARDQGIFSVVSRGGRPDLAMNFLSEVKVPVLLIVGGEDGSVITLNKEAAKKIEYAQVVVVPGAGHLFEEPGTLEEVIEYAGEWFEKTLSNTGIELNFSPKELVIEEIKELSHPMDSMESLRPLLRKLGESRVVMLGESSHGTEEYYQWRKIISERLIEDYGFNFIAVEGDWPDCFRVNKYLLANVDVDAALVLRQFKRWPTWMWSNRQVLDLVERLKGKKVGFYGLDVYSLYESLDLIKSYAQKLNPVFAERVLEAYSCLDSFDRDEISYAKSVTRWPDGCERQILKNLRDLLRLRLEETQLEQMELFDLQQNAKVIKNAESYYRALLSGGPESWNIRDEHMMDTLDALLRFHGEGAKGIVWAHNTHIGDYHATDMVTEGYVNLGGLARERYGMAHVSLAGFGTYQGSVRAGKAWGASSEVMELPAAPVGSYEDYFHRVSEELRLPQFYIMMDGRESLSLRRGHRAVGVVYQPSFEFHGRNYVPTELSRRYDHFIFIDKTTALRDLPQASEKGRMPDTWPIGV